MSRRRNPLPDDPRLLDLLTDRAIEGLSTERAKELEGLLSRHSGIDADGLELAAAAVHLAFVGEERAGVEPMPDALRRRILAAAPAHLPSAPSGSAPQRDELEARRRERRRPAWRDPRNAGWYVAAAMLVLALFAWRGLPERGAEAPATTTLAAQREQLLRQAGDVVTVAWAPPEAAGFGDVTGDVVWSNSLQRGFLRLRGMPVNDPRRQQYQLWIVDPERDANPIDGGVFDIGSSGEQIVPIDAKLEVLRPRAFAITREKPGGVVVSGGPLLVVAPLES